MRGLLTGALTWVFALGSGPVAQVGSSLLIPDRAAGLQVVVALALFGLMMVGFCIVTGEFDRPRGR